MTASLSSLATCLALFLGMLACLELGHRFGRHRGAVDGTAHEGIGAIEVTLKAERVPFQ